LAIRVYELAEVQAFERQLGFKLPIRFREQVLATGIDSERYEFLLEDMLKMFTRHTPDPLARGQSAFPYQELPKGKWMPIDPSNRLQVDPAGALPICDTGCGIFLWLVVSGTLRGTEVIADGSDMMLHGSAKNEPDEGPT
jgi:hypothetical protein